MLFYIPFDTLSEIRSLGISDIWVMTNLNIPFCTLNYEKIKLGKQNVLEMSLLKLHRNCVTWAPNVNNLLNKLSYKH